MKPAGRNPEGAKRAHRPRAQGREAGRSASAAADQIPTGAQHEDRQKRLAWTFRWRCKLPPTRWSN